MSPNIARPVELLVGLREIAKFLKVSTEKVKDMEQLGAPLLRDPHGVLRTEKAELWEWFKTR